MSLILDALNRSRDSTEPVPTLSTHHPVEPLADSRNVLPWIALALALALVVIAWLVWDRFSTPAGTAPAGDSPVAELTHNLGSAAASVTSQLKARAEVAREGGQPVQPPSPVYVEPPPVAVSTQAAEVTARPAVPVDSVKAPAVAEKAGAAVPKPEAAQVARSAMQDPEVARLYRDRTVPEEKVKPAEEPQAAVAPQEQGREEQPLDIENILQRAQRESGNAGLQDHPVPVLSTLSQRIKDEVPTIYYQRHDYSSNTANSTVVLNGKTVRTGGSPGTGLKVQEILPDSVVLDYRGTQFRLRALNSWVNL